MIIQFWKSIEIVLLKS